MTFPEPYATWFPDATFDGSYGRTEADLRAVRPVPAPHGFADRWRRWRREAAAVDAAPVVLSTSEEQGRRVSVVEHAGVDGVRLRAWVVEPLDGPPRAGVVHGHGYGGRDAVDLARVPDDVAAIYPVARGLGVLNAGIGAPEPTPEHVLAGIDDPERYVLGLCARDLWLAADVLVSFVGALPLYYVGESFGGGIGALALPWDDRFVGATLIVPSFGQYDERLAVPCLGSGETVRQHVLRHPEAREVLRWFDSSTAIGFSAVPVRVEAALWDQYVPPQGQFAVAAGARDLDLAVLPAGHAEYPGSAEVTASAIRGGREHLERVLAG
ncbi:MAG: acetylesterase [Microbacterium sp.]|nr:acetylesterase [Microbacterium sp.]